MNDGPNQCSLHDECMLNTKNHQEGCNDGLFFSEPLAPSLFLHLIWHFCSWPRLRIQLAFLSRLLRRSHCRQFRQIQVIFKKNMFAKLKSSIRLWAEARIQDSILQTKRTRRKLSFSIFVALLWATEYLWVIKEDEKGGTLDTRKKKVQKTVVWSKWYFWPLKERQF